MPFEEPADRARVVPGELLKDRNEHGQRVVADDRAARDLGHAARLRDGNREAVPTVDVQHHVQIGTAVAHVHDAVAWHAQRGSERVDRLDLAVPGSHAIDRGDLARLPVELQSRPDDVVWCDDAVERCMDDLLRRRRHHVEVEPMPVDSVLQQCRESSDVALQPDVSPYLEQVGPPHTAVLRVVPKQVRELGAFLHEIELGETRDLGIETIDPEPLAQQATRIVEAERLVEVADQQIVPAHDRCSHPTACAARDG